MGESKLIVGLVGGSALLVMGAVVVGMKWGSSAKVAVNNQAKVSVENSSYDWGEIGINDGDAEAVFEIKNEGSEALKLYNVTTSCACTSAQLSLNDKVSPLFGMHSKSGYVMEVPAGEAATLKVVYDPNFHGPNGVGAISRQVSVATNDPDKAELTFWLSAMVRK